MAPLTLAELERVARGGAPAPLSADGARAARARTRDRRRDGRRGHGRVRRHDGLRRPLVGAHRRGRRRAAPAQPRPLARDRRRRAAARRGRARDAAAARQQPLQGPLGRAPRARRAACSACSSATSCRSCRAAARSAPRATWRRSRTSRSCSAARARRPSRASGWTAARRCGAPGSRPIELAAKEGLALINGTHLMAACGALALRDARRLLDAAIVTAALSLEAFMGSTTPFDARIHDLRRHPGQGAVAARLRALLEGSADRREPRRLRARAGSVHAALRAAGARRHRRRARLRRGRARARARLRDRQPAALPRRRRGLSRAATSTASRSRSRSTTSGSRCASWPRSPSGAPTRCSRRATPGCRASSRPTPASRRA